jgi:hypothetical protein
VITDVHYSAEGFGVVGGTFGVQVSVDDFNTYAQLPVVALNWTTGDSQRIKYAAQQFSTGLVVPENAVLNAGGDEGYVEGNGGPLTFQTWVSGYLTN